jgi:hypothetical protein
MSMQSWMETIVNSIVDGTALANSTSETSIAPADSKITLAANYFARPGAGLRIMAAGRISTVVTTPGTLTFKVKLGPSANIAVATSPAFALNVVAKTNVTWWLEWLLTLRTAGSGTAAAFMNIGQWTSEAIVASPAPSAGGTPTLMIPASAPAVGTGFDSTVSNALDLTAQWSIANAANSIQTHMLVVQSLN